MIIVLNKNSIKEKIFSLLSALIYFKAGNGNI